MNLAGPRGRTGHTGSSGLWRISTRCTVQFSPVHGDHFRAFVLPSQSFLSWLVINCMQYFLVLNVTSGATLRHIHKLYRLYIFMRDGRHFELHALNGEATLWHKLSVHELYSFFAVYQQTNKCTVVKSSNGIGNVAAETVRIWKSVSWLN